MTLIILLHFHRPAIMLNYAHDARDSSCDP